MDSYELGDSEGDVEASWVLDEVCLASSAEVSLESEDGS